MIMLAEPEDYEGGILQTNRTRHFMSSTSENAPRHRQKIPTNDDKSGAIRPTLILGPWGVGIKFRLSVQFRSCLAVLQGCIDTATCLPHSKPVFVLFYDDSEAMLQNIPMATTLCSRYVLFEVRQ